ASRAGANPYRGQARVRRRGTLRRRGVRTHPNETGETGAMTLAERIREKVEAATFPGGLKLTVSIGVATTDDEALFTSLIEKADQALYSAKQAGRNTVRVADMRGVGARRE